MTREDPLVAAGPSVGTGRWLGVLDGLMTGTGSRFRRVEPRRRARAFVLGLLAELPRKNCWTIAGLRWTIEENFQAGKGLTGLDEHQARRWTS